MFYSEVKQETARPAPKPGSPASPAGKSGPALRRISLTPQNIDMPPGKEYNTMTVPESGAARAAASARARRHG